MASIQADSKISLRDGFKNIAGIVSSFDQSLAHDLKQLGELLFCDVDTGLLQLREGLPRILRKPKPFNKFSDSARFFETYKVLGGRRLSADSVHKLVGIASRFPTGAEAERNEQDFERKFRDNPESFWSLLSRPQDPSAISIIRHISESFDEQEYLHPIRRRIILSVLFERVQLELQRIQATGNILKRGQTFKGVANDALLDCLWNATDQSTKRKRERFNRNVRAGGKWTRFEPGVLIGLADQQAWTLWEKSMNDEELKAIADYMSSLPAHERWKGLSSLALRLKSAFLSYLTGAGGFATQTASGKRKRVDENRDFQDQIPSRQKRRAHTHPPSGHEIVQDAALSRGHSQSPTWVSHPHMVSNMVDSLQVLAEVATTTGAISNECPTPLLDTSFMNVFDISALQPPHLGDTSFMDEMNVFENPADPHSVSRLPSLSDIPCINGTNDFANTSCKLEISHQEFIDSSSFNHSMNDFDIYAGQEGVSSCMDSASPAAC